MAVTPASSETSRYMGATASMRSARSLTQWADTGRTVSVFFRGTLVMVATASTPDGVRNQRQAVAVHGVDTGCPATSRLRRRPLRA